MVINMILYRGKEYDTSCQKQLLAVLEEDINNIRSTRRLDIAKVIDAVDTLSKKLAGGVYADRIAQLGIEGIHTQLQTVIAMTSKENLEYRLLEELGEENKESLLNHIPIIRNERLQTRILPKGTLFHIAAGNREGLPVYSVIEGLLTGNVNILKLPQADGGLSIEILQELMKIEPSVADFVFVFDTPSSDLEGMQKMAEVSDVVIVWGGVEAVAAVRKFAPIGAELIEWGHKLSFAYLSQWHILQEERLQMELEALAEHIVSTRQLLCSSCQVIYLDTEDLMEAKCFCERFLPVLEKATSAFPAKSIGMQAELSLRRYCDTLQKVLSGQRTEDNIVFQGKGCSLTLCKDNELELSDMFGNCFVKLLPKKKMCSVLRKNKGYLQTAGLLCPDEQRGEFSGLLADCGIVRITFVGNMSEVFLGEAHDGEYPLRRYIRAVDEERRVL